MSVNRLLILVFFIILFFKVEAQKHTGEKFLRLEAHPSDDNRFIAKFFSKENFKLIEYWEMASTVSEITAENFNQLKTSRKIYAHGESILFYPSLRKKQVTHYENGLKSGEVTGYYETGTIRYRIKLNGPSRESAKYYYPDGKIKKTEVYDNYKLGFKTTGFYENGQKKYESNYINGQLNGKYQSFFENGKQKRKSKFKDNNEVSSTCFDANGVKIDCQAYCERLNYQNDFQELKTEIEKLDFSFNKENIDTADFRIILEIDTIGKANLVFYYFSHADSIKPILTKWVNQLQTFSPTVIDGFSCNSYLNMSFTIAGEQIVWLGEGNVSFAYTALHGSNEIKPTFYWEFPNPTNDQVFFIVDNLPKFPGGERALKSFISDHLSYPQEARKERIQGKVYVTFIVEKDGSVSSPKIAKSVHHLLDAEAIRVIKLLPKWQPGSIRGMQTRVSYTVPINFALN